MGINSASCLQVLTWNILERTCIAEPHQECFSPFFTPRHKSSIWGCGTLFVTVADQKTRTEHWGVTACPTALTDCTDCQASSGQRQDCQAALKGLGSVKWLECFLSVFSVEGTAEKCGFSRPLWLYNMYQPFPAAAAAAAGALKTDFMCRLCHPCGQMDDAFRKRGSSFYMLQPTQTPICRISFMDLFFIFLTFSFLRCLYQD